MPGNGRELLRHFPPFVGGHCWIRLQYRPHSPGNRSLCCPQHKLRLLSKSIDTLERSAPFECADINSTASATCTHRASPIMGQREQYKPRFENMRSETQTDPMKQREKNLFQTLPLKRNFTCALSRSPPIPIICSLHTTLFQPELLTDLCPNAIYLIAPFSPSVHFIDNVAISLIRSVILMLLRLKRTIKARAAALDMTRTMT